MTSPQPLEFSHRPARSATAPRRAGLIALAAWLGGAGCGSSSSNGRSFACQVADPANAPDFTREIGCLEDFLALSSAPLSASIPGARSVKTSVDLEVGSELSFQNTGLYPIHWDYLSEHRSVGQGMPRVAELTQFNQVEYTRPQRRFLLGALTHYEGPDVWAYEVSPYDNADASMIREAFELIRDATYVGDRLRFHPTSEGVEAVASALPDSVPLVATDELFGDYQPLNVAESLGRLTFVQSDQLEGCSVGFRDIVVLDSVPNDISVTQGIVTSAFQTPLSHVNVLSQNRGTPNMALRGAFDDPELRALEGKWVRVRVGALDYDIAEVTEAEANAWWDANRPAEVQVPGIDLERTELTDVEAIVDVAADDLLAGIKAGTRAFGGKAANYGALAQIEGVPVPKAFAVPVVHYRRFMEQNGFVERVQSMLDDPEFQADGCVRERELESLRDEMLTAPVDPEFEAALRAKIQTDFPPMRMRFRSSTNAEDLDGFTGAGLYTSRSGDYGDEVNYPVLDAVRRVWRSVWRFRAFEERAYRNIPHLDVGMALLVHRSFPEEEANGVALTNNPFDRSGVDPAFYVNVQVRDLSVVQPDPWDSTEEFLYYYDQQNKPITYLSKSSFTAGTERVISPSQVQALGDALSRLQGFFRRAYAPPGGAWWAMDVEFKFDGEPGTPRGEEPLFVKQARPFGNR